MTDSLRTTSVSNAGLVLLAPFLSTYFDRLGLLEEGQFRDILAKKRAVYLLQYLVFGSTDYQEYELTLNKLLVGLTFEERLEPVEALSDEEIEISESLLNGVIGNWEKLGNSSVAALQETFLQREGVLEFKPDMVILRIEKKGVDVLLHSVPWNFSTVKLSWMSMPLHVDWN